MNEMIWVDVVGFEGYYKISNRGSVLSVASGELRKLTLNRGGYYHLTIHKKGHNKNITVHRLVATGFIPNPFNLPAINHKNGIKTDNRVENLEWCTYQENTLHAMSMGLKKNRTSESFTQEERDSIAIRKSKPILQIDRSGRIIGKFDSMKLAAKMVGKSAWAIYQARYMRRLCAGFYWKHA